MPTHVLIRLEFNAKDCGSGDDDVQRGRPHLALSRFREPNALVKSVSFPH
jgi:hypothetical protein